MNHLIDADNLYKHFGETHAVRRFFGPYPGRRNLWFGWIGRRGEDHYHAFIVRRAQSEFRQCGDLWL